MVTTAPSSSTKTQKMSPQFNVTPAREGQEQHYYRMDNLQLLPSVPKQLIQHIEKKFLAVEFDT